MAGYNVTEGEYWAETLDWPEDERWLGIYLKTCEYRLSEGVFRAPAHVIAFELAGEHGSWTVDRVRSAMEGLQQRGWLAVEGNWVCVANALEVGSHKKMSASQIKGCLDRLTSAPTGGPVWEMFTAAAKRWQPPLAAVITGELVIVKSEKERGLVLAPASTTPDTTPPTTSVTGAPTTPVTGVVAQAEKPEKWEPDWGSHRGTDSLNPPPPTPTPPHPPTQPSSSNLARILEAAAAGPSTVLAGQVDNQDERKAIGQQLLIAGDRADALTSLVVEWLSRSGQPMKIERLSKVVVAAFQKIGEASAASTPAALQIVDNVQPEAIAAWADVLEEIRRRGVDPATVELWLEPLSAVSLAGRVLTLGGAPHLVTWVNARGTTLLTSAAQTCGLLDLQVVAAQVGAAA